MAEVFDFGLHALEPAAMFPAEVVTSASPLARGTDAVQIDITPTTGEKGIWALATVTSPTGDVLMPYPE